jgi:hypothetical protein
VSTTETPAGNTPMAASFQPPPPDGIYRIEASLLDEAEAVFQTHMGEALPSTAVSTADPFAGLRDHALGWAVGRLRDRISAESWACMEDGPTSNAVTHVAGFLHFVATWSGHPLFPAMAATAAGRGFSLHGLAPFAAAHCLTMMGNQITFPDPQGYPGRIGVFQMATKAGPAAVHCQPFDRFEYPFGRKWDHASLRAEVNAVVGGAQNRINLRNPGALILSPGTALNGFDDALIAAIEEAMPVQGRKNRGLMTVAPVVLRLRPLQDPHAVQFGYGCFPSVNKYYRLEPATRTAG